MPLQNPSRKALPKMRPSGLIFSVKPKESGTYFVQFDFVRYCAVAEISAHVAATTGRASDSLLMRLE